MSSQGAVGPERHGEQGGDRLSAGHAKQPGKDDNPRPDGEQPGDEAPEAATGVGERPDPDHAGHTPADIHIDSVGSGSSLDDITLDADFIRGATVREPSARARMLARKWARQPPPQQPWRDWSPASPERRSPRAGRRRRITLTVIGGALVAGTAVGVVVLHPGSLGGNNLPIAPPVAVPVPEPTIDPADPFAGSPAEKYVSGEAGIRLPRAAAKGSFTAAEVSKALTLAKRYLVAADLDTGTVIRQQTAAVLALLDPLGPRQGLDKALHRRSKYGPLNYLTRFDPHETALVGSTIKVNGWTSYHLAAPDQLVVHMDYLIVYAVRRAGSANGEVTRVLVRHIFDFSIYHHRLTTPGRLWIIKQREVGYGVHCRFEDGYLHPEYASELTDESEKGVPQDPYDQSREPSGEGCLRVTRR